MTRPPKAQSTAAQQRAPTRVSARRRPLPDTKSPYFEHPSEDEAGSAEEEDESEGDGEVSDFEDPAAELVSDDDEDDGEDEDVEEEGGPESDAPEPVNPKKRARAAASHGAKRVKQKRPKEVIVPYRTAEPGDTEYQDYRIHPNTLDFLKDLRENNDRAWLRENDLIYRAAKADFESFVEHLNEKMPTDVDDTLPELPIKDLVFRIHRDIRFSNDQTPYKTYFSVAWSRTGRKGPYAAYYLHLEPGGRSMAGAGLWHPPAPQLAAIRKTLTDHPARLKSILEAPAFRESFLNDHDAASPVEAFAKHNAEDALKTAPKGYAKDHPEIVLLRLRSFTVAKRIPDHEVTGAGFEALLMTLFRKMEPLVEFLNDVVMPDPAL